MKLKHIISAHQFNKKTLDKIFMLTNRIKAGKFKKDALYGKIMATLFYEPSTRTRFSFESAMIRLGGNVIATENAGEFSSAAKGETLEDTIRVINSYCDLIVIRHPKKGASEVASKYSQVPIINAGDGEGEHPTQAILDIYTIFSEFTKKNLKVAMIGDLKYGRTVHSLSYLLALYPNIKIIYISPKALTLPQAVSDYLKNKQVDFIETEDFKSYLPVIDIVYQTRIQKERFSDIRDFRKYYGRYVIDKKILNFLKKTAIVMHPLPRVNEIRREVDQDQRAIYFEQAQNGIFTRMALLLLLFDKVKL